MKKIIPLLVVILSLVGSLTAEYKTATITSSDIRADINFMNKHGIDVDKVQGNTIYLYLFEDDIDTLSNNGYSINYIPNQAKEYADQLWEETKNTRDPMRDYFSYNEYVNFMQNTVSDHPDICQLIDIGDSVNGNDILFLKISDNVTLDEAEPEVRYIATIHGDEPIGLDQMARLINQLTDDYGTDQRITDIVNNTELWINPLMNPDGYINHERYNQNGVDLNRNFPTPAGVQHPDGNTWQPETQAIMNWTEGHYFTASLVFHSGATVMNYPWDYTPTLAPDDLLFQEMSLTYVENNSTMYNSTEFNNGITNGNAWYETHGSIQDWSYHTTNCFDITCEQWDVKWPNESLLPSLWNENQESLLSYIEFAQNGIKGIVTDDSRTPIEAEIIIEGNAKTILSHPNVGDYHRLLLPGTYTITARKDGYRSVTVEDVVVPASGHVTVNFELAQAQEITFNGVARHGNGTLFNAGQLTFDAENSFNVDTEGRFTATMMQGEYSVVAFTEATFLNTEVSLWDSSEDICIVFSDENVLFSDDFESGLSHWQTTGSWGIENSNGSNTLSDSPSGQYSNNLNIYSRIASPIQTSGLPVQIKFDMFYDLEEGYDYGYLEVSSNGTVWDEIDSYNDFENWHELTYDITGYDNLYVRFRLDTDQGVTANGMKIDNFEVTSSLPIIGDINNDRIISKSDIDMYADYVLNEETNWTLTSFDTANTDNNDIIDYMDAGILRRYMRGNLDQMPVQSGVDLQLMQPSIDLIYYPSSQASPEPEFQIINYGVGQIVAFIGIIDLLEPHPSTFNATHSAGYYAYTDQYKCLFIPNIEENMEIYISDLMSYVDSPEDTEATISCNYYEFNEQIDVLPNDESSIPQIQTELLGNFPNPFNPTTTINFSIAHNNTKATLSVYDVKGRTVNTLVDGMMNAGKQSIEWNGLNSNGSKVASGIYFYRLEAGDVKQTEKMVLMK